MAHGKVFRRSMSLEEWAWLELSRLEDAVTLDSIEVPGWQVREGQYYPDHYEWETEFQPIEQGQYWGYPDAAVQFKGTVTVPERMAGKKVWFGMRIAGEVIASVDGNIYDGIDPNRQRIILADPAEGGRKYEFVLDAYVRSRPDDHRNRAIKPIHGCVQKFNIPRLVVLDEEIQAAVYDVETLLEAAFSRWTPADVQSYLQKQVRELVKLFPQSEAPREELIAAIPGIRAFLKQKVYNRDLPYGKSGRLACVAHSHLDIGYLWKAVQTIQKNARTTLIQLRMMERFPGFLYAHSQAWCYETLEKYYPDLFAQVAERVKEGRWEIVGGMYVEPDGNVPSAEAMVRQVMYGKRYFLDKFGIEVDNCWLPDNFGNSAIMPQILKKAGIDYFMSNKMSTWNDVNKFPHHTFKWRGLDGSEVYGCIPPMHFISWNTPEQVLRSWSEYNDKELCGESLHMYGYGDGGSGVTEDMLERLSRLSEMPGFPETRLTTGRDFLHSTMGKGGDKLPVWDGELYLEMHRGTYTTKGDLKYQNRLCEFLAAETEALCTIAGVHGRAYPLEEITSAWKNILVNQFHDIIPGSHTQPVFEEAMQTYAQIRKVLENARKSAFDMITAPAGESSVCVFNPLSDSRSGVVTIEGKLDKVNPCGMRDASGTVYPCQVQVAPDGATRMVTTVSDIAPLSTVTLTQEETAAETNTVQATGTTLANSFFELDLNKKGEIVSLFDKRHQREVITDGAVGNEWQIFQDRPGQFNAWDLHARYPDHKIPLGDEAEIEVVENGPISAAIKVTRRFLHSKSVQIIRVYNSTPRIDFETWIDWHETERILKVAFPVQIRSRVFTTDTSAGILERENHENTSWQQARFEVGCHKWVDLSEGLFGVALMNNCKYGCDVKGDTMRLSLLRSPISPDPVSDKGEHRFTYSIFTHGGDWRRDGLAEAALDLNQPLKGLVGRKGKVLEDTSFLTVRGTGVKVQSLKMDEDGNGDIIVRLVEIYGSRGPVTLETAFGIADANECDLLERPVGDSVEKTANTCTVSMKPYGIKTIRLKKR